MPSPSATPSSRTVANGKRTKSELQGLGDEEFAPWILGPVL
jgi:altronate hydrolase